MRQNPGIGREGPEALIKYLVLPAKPTDLAVISGLGMEAVLDHGRFDVGISIQTLKLFQCIAIVLGQAVSMPRNPRVMASSTSDAVRSFFQAVP